MDLQTAINQAVEMFHIKLSNGLEFWAPYLRNDNFTQNSNVPRGLGKSSADDIRAAGEYIISQFPDIDSQGLRQKLIDGSLADQTYNYKGIDCSGFAYYVYEDVYQKLLHKSVIDDLSLPKSHVLNGAFNLDEWKAAYQMSRQEADALPDDVPLRWVVDTFHRRPASLCRVSGLLSDFASVAIEIDAMRVGDMVDLKPFDYAYHVAIITNIDGHKVSIAHSGGGSGVVIETIDYNAEGLLTEQMLVPRSYGGIRRLKSLNQLA